MTTENDPWKRWYGTYLTGRAALKAAKLQARERARAANTVAGLLVAYMLIGGVVASVAICLVMAN